MSISVVDALKSRRTIRQYDPTYSIPPEVINELIDVAFDSPTGMNSQEIDIIVLTDHAKIDEAIKVTFNSWPADQQARWNKRKETYGVTNVVTCDAPVIFVFVLNERSLKCPFAEFDAGVITMAVMAAARHYGLHTMCLGALQYCDRDGFEAVLGIPKGRFVMALAIGKPADKELVLLDKKRQCKARIID